jgi:hypothetical protein
MYDVRMHYPIGAAEANDEGCYVLGLWLL